MAKPWRPLGGVWDRRANNATAPSARYPDRRAADAPLVPPVPDFDQNRSPYLCLRCGYPAEGLGVPTCPMCSEPLAPVRLATLVEAQDHLLWLQKHHDALQASVLAMWLRRAKRLHPERK